MEFKRADSPCARAAREYIERGWSVIPLKRGGKVPVTRRGLNDASDNPGQVDVWWDADGRYGDPWYNVAIVCGSVSGGLLAIDLDRHGDADGLNTLREWETANGELPQTLEVETGSGGRHLLYRVGRPIRPSANGELGVDVRCEGSYIVAPPSIHPNGEPYEWLTSPEDMDVADADEAVYAFLDYVRPSRPAGEGGAGERFDLPEAIERNRNDTLFRYASSLRSTGRSEGEVSILVHAANRERCRPPLPEAEVDKIVRSACRYERGDGLGYRPVAKMEQGGAKAARGRLDRPERPEKAERRSKLTTFEICEMMLADESISRGIRFDVLDRRPWKMGPLPWDPEDSQRPLTDGDKANLFGTLEYGKGVCSERSFKIAFEQFLMAPSQRVNAIEQVLAGLPRVEAAFGEDGAWPDTVTLVEGERREDVPAMAGHLMNLFLGAPDDEYTTEVELLMLRQLVARMAHPGCKADSMVVLCGAQGIGKSTFTRALALSDRFYLEGVSRFDEEHKRRLIGKTVAEVSELEGFNHNDMASIKQAITAPKDNIRMPYREYAEDFPRTCIFIGTTNEGAFLTDTTGNRRFLPVECGNPACQASPMLFDGTLETCVRQAVAEVAAYMRAVGPEAFLRTLTPPARIMAQVLDAQEEVTQEDDVLTAVASWLDELPASIDRVNVKMAMVEGMGYKPVDFAREKRYRKNEVAAALSKCEGWRKMRGKQKVYNGQLSYGISLAWERI